MLLHSYFVQNETLLKVDSYQPNTGIEIYEMIRVIKNIPLFLEDHLKRFFHSAWLCHLEIPMDAEVISSSLKKLIDANGVEEGNIRFSYSFRPTGNFQAYFIPYHYPDENDIRHGIRCGILHAERSDPKAKVVQAGLLETANQMIEEKGYYEVLLVNQQSAFTEGSRSNLFFVREDTFITSPSEEVLPGITRNKVIELLISAGKNLEEKSLRTAELPFVKAAFLTGTSPKVLPIRTIDDFSFDTDLPEIRDLITRYDQLVKGYIDKKHRSWNKEHSK